MVLDLCGRCIPGERGGEGGYVYLKGGNKGEKHQITFILGSTPKGAGTMAL